MVLNGELRQFVTDSFLFGKADKRLTDDDSLLELGIIDSTGVLEIVSFVEERYGIKLRDWDLVPENLDSINRLARFIESRLQPI
jgi:acyl carrier protein